MISGHGRHATPVVDAGVEQNAEIVGQIGRRLQVDLGRQDDSRGGDRPEELVLRAGRVVLHAGSWLGEEVLHDHFLHVTVTSVRVGDSHQGVDAISARFADTDQDPRRERDLELAGRFQSREATFGSLVGCTAMAREIVTQRLDHHPLARAHRSQSREIVAIECAGIGVGQQTGLVENESSHGHEVVDGRCVAVGIEPVAGDGVALFRCLTESEQRFVAPRLRSAFGDRENFVGREVRALEPGRRLGEGAVAARVTTQHRERNEHLG